MVCMAEKIKKLKGGNDLFVSEDEKFLVNYNSRNSVYVYDLAATDTKPLFSVRTVSNVGEVCISPDKKLIAAKNTSGEMAVISLETGEELLRNKMKQSEGYRIVFTDDGRYVLDFDWNGTTMLLDWKNNEFKVLDGPNIRGENGKPYIAYMGYDRYSKQIYKFVEGEKGFNKCRGVAKSSKLKRGKVKYKVIHEFNGHVPDFHSSISFCKEHNYYCDLQTGEIVKCDKDFNEIERRPYPSYYDGQNKRLIKCWVSPLEKYALMDSYQGPLILCDMVTGKVLRDFDYLYVCGFTMINEDKTFIIPTWEGTYIGNL